MDELIEEIENDDVDDVKASSFSSEYSKKENGKKKRS